MLQHIDLKNFVFLPVCTDKLGVKNGDIPNANLQASYSRSSHPAYKARLDGSSVWSVEGKIPSPWIQADIGYVTSVSGLLTQGDGGTFASIANKDWITQLKVSTSSAADEPQVFIKEEDGEDKVTIA